MTSRTERSSTPNPALATEKTPEIGNGSTPKSPPKFANVIQMGVLYFLRSFEFPIPDTHPSRFRIVLFTNQGGLRQQAADSTNVMAFKSKLRQIATQLKVPITALVATNYDWNRKPGTGMLEFLLSNLNDGIDIDRAESFFVGDAAGRIAGWKPGASKDFSDSDRKFALNAGIPFYTPEEFFKCEPATTKFTLSGFDPRPLLTQSFDPYPPDFFNPPKPGQQEIVVLVGRPGAGKTTVAQKFFPRHVWVNQDTLKTKEKCAKVVEDEIRIGRSVVVDNTNPSKGVRNTYVSLKLMLSISFKLTRCRVDRAGIHARNPSPLHLVHRPRGPLHPQQRRSSRYGRSQVASDVGLGRVSHQFPGTHSG